MSSRPNSVRFGTRQRCAGLRGIGAEAHRCNALQVHKLFEADHEIHLVQELLEGGDLFDKIVEWKHYTEGAAMRLVRTLLGVCRRPGTGPPLRI